MTFTAHRRWVWVAGWLAAAGLAVWAYLAWVQPRSQVAAPAAAVLATADTAARAEDAVAPAPPVAMAAAPSSCAFEPMLESTGAGDGQFVLAPALASHRSSDPAPFLAVADEAAREGKARDAEVALIAACRIASQAGATSAPVADVQTRLARHYAEIARQQPDGRARTTLLERAESLLGETVQTYAAALGQEASKTRLAQQRLASLRQPAPVLEARSEPPVAAAAPATSRLGAARSSLAERAPLPSEDTREIDQDLARLYAQARAVSRDPAGVQQRHQQALARRSACADEACLRNWYAQRRRELFAEF